MPLTKRLIAVGDSADIEIVYGTSRYSGLHRKSTTIVTSDITKGNVSLLLSSNVISRTDTIAGIIVVDPPFIKIAQDERDVIFGVSFTNVSDVPLTPRLVSAPHEVFEIKYPSGPIDPGGSIKIEVHLKAGTEAKTAKKSFTFEFDDPARTRFTLPVQLLLEERRAVRPAGSAEASGVH